MPVHDLEILHGIFDIDEAAGAVFYVHRAWLDELLQLCPAQIQGRGEIPGLAAVDIVVPMAFDLLAEGGVAGDGAELDHRLAFEGRG